jgi:phytoene synthase
MDLYTRTAGQMSQVLTNNYSTSFGLATRLFGAEIRPHIYNVYGLVRLADEIVDTYTGSDAGLLLNDLQAETHAAIPRGYSTNTVVHAFAVTAKKFGIDASLIDPFFESMRIDLHPKNYKSDDYERYIYGSAQVVGLMCLKVFCQGDAAQYKKLESGAKALGGAFQKVNFLRDIADDHERLGRYYFPVGSFKDFDEETKMYIVLDIDRDFALAHEAIVRLPVTARPAVMAAYKYYLRLHNKLRETPADVIKKQRIRVSNPHKLAVLAGTLITEKLRDR